MLLQTFTASIQDITGQDLSNNVHDPDPNIEDELDRLRLRVEELNIEVRRAYPLLPYWIEFQA